MLTAALLSLAQAIPEVAAAIRARMAAAGQGTVSFIEAPYATLPQKGSVHE